MFRHELSNMLEAMQENDRNGDWKGAPLNDDTVWAMYDSLCRWYDETNGRHIQIRSMLGELEDMYDNVYARVQREYPVSMLDLSILKAQHKEITVYEEDGQMYVNLVDEAFPANPWERIIK